MKDKSPLVFALCLLLPSLVNTAEPNVGNLAHRLVICETEIGMLTNKLENQEIAREALEKEVSQMLKAARDSLKESSEQSGARQKSFDKALEKLTTDLKQLKNHCNDLSSILNDLSKTIVTLKEDSSAQALVIKELEQAMRGLTLAFGAKSSSSGAVHVVRSGDSLEKIARQYGITVAELKELNNLKSTTIRTGQELIVRSK